MTETIDRAFATRAYYGSSGPMTTMLYQHLEAIGPVGFLAVNLLRACKTSERAKKYRGGDGRGSYRSQSYSTKEWAIGNICSVLKSNKIEGIERWGWGIDGKLQALEDPHHHVLYVDLPTGQVSFHTGTRKLDCPDYPGEWDGVVGKGADRILRYVGRLLGDTSAEVDAA